MASIGGKTKQVQCIVCNEIITVSLYANPQTAKCKSCKKTSAIAGKSTIQDGNLQKMVKQNDTKPVHIRLHRNRQEIEAQVIMDTGEVIERVPTEWLKSENNFDNFYLSVSKMDTYGRCPAQFYELYINNENPNVDNGNIFTWFGSILHEVVEICDKAYKDNGLKLNPIALYDEAWKKRELTDFSMYKEGRQLVLDYFNNHPKGERQHKCIEVELEWRGKLGEVDSFGCMFDYIGEVNPEVGLYMDYKSNRQPFTQYELQDSLQLQVYEIILRKLYPQYKRWITGYELFRFGWQQAPEHTEEDLEATQQYINNMWYQIKNDNTWEERLNPFCGYCMRKHKCNKYAEFVTSPKKLIDTIVVDESSLESVEKAREIMSTYEKIAKNRKNELSKSIKARIEMAVKNQESLVIDGKELYLQAQSRPFYDYSGVRNIMAIHGRINDLDNCISINKTKLDALAKGDPQLNLELQKCLIQTYSAPYIMKRKNIQKNK